MTNRQIKDKHKMWALETKARKIQAELDKLQTQWEAMKDSVNENNYQMEDRVNYNWSDVLA